jgi:hypothetical protein
VLQSEQRPHRYRDCMLLTDCLTLLLSLVFIVCILFVLVSFRCSR